jgi:phosphoribosylanthranilate isomerase
VLARIKFCGMTRASDASLAAELGASYVGAVLARGPRQVSTAVARELFESAREVAHVGVFGSNDIREIGTVVDQLELDVVQLHADPSPDDVHAVRSRFGGDVWAALRIAGGTLPEGAEELFDAADGIILDAKSGDRLGGTGLTIRWSEVAGELARLRGPGLMILAGGLTPQNVTEAIRALAPDVVDVSSGVEQSPGVKDYHLMREFADAVGGVGVAP